VNQIQIFIQLTIGRTIYQYQFLSLDEMTFTQNGVNKHGFAYIALACTRTKEKLYLLHPLTTLNFQIDMGVYLGIESGNHWYQD